MKDEELECVATRSLVSLEFAAMTNSLELELVKVTVILNEKAQKHRSGLWTLKSVIKE
ncbi:hypothetical protein VCHENC03_3341 [Vibrio sp. HENC-03]|nr:hypothetical protein VCHENC03_3341 [Vibrio sp. HENC-03]